MTRPDYNLPMELLMTLQKEPDYSICVELCEDLKIPKPSMLAHLVRTLNEMGFKVRMFNLRGIGRVMQIEKEGWEMAQMAAREYARKAKQS